MVVEKVLKEQIIKQIQIETELHYKHNYLVKVLVKHKRQLVKHLANNHNLATLQPALAGQTVAGLQAAGSSDLAYRQAGEDARRQAARLSAYEPYERTSYLASGLGSLGGMTTPLSPAMTGMSSPQMSPLQTALSLGTTLGGIYGSVKG